MTDRVIPRFALSIVWITAAWSASLAGDDPGAKAKKADVPRKVLVELFTSQGCNSCPPASDFVGEFPELGFGTNRVVALNFHVDYFNTPWVDPFSDPAYSRRQLQYNSVQGRGDLYFTPMMMIDGRTPMLGSNRAKAVPTIKTSAAEKPGVALDASLQGAAAARTLAVKLSAPSADAAGRDLLVFAAVTATRVSTHVASGENAGRTLVEHHVVRSFELKPIKLDRDESRSLSFALKLPGDLKPENARVAVFVQDRNNGKVYQADSIPWIEPKPADAKAERTEADRRRLAVRKARHAAALAVAARDASTLSALIAAFDDDDAIPCPACGAPIPAGLWKPLATSRPGLGGARLSDLMSGAC